MNITKFAMLTKMNKKTSQETESAGVESIWDLSQPFTSNKPVTIYGFSTTQTGQNLRIYLRYTDADTDTNVFLDVFNGGMTALPSKNTRFEIRQRFDGLFISFGKGNDNDSDLTVKGCRYSMSGDATLRLLNAKNGEFTLVAENMSGTAKVITKI